jgi:hypothetical protein
MQSRDIFFQEWPLPSRLSQQKAACGLLDGRLPSLPTLGRQEGNFYFGRAFFARLGFTRHWRSLFFPSIGAEKISKGSRTMIIAIFWGQGFSVGVLRESPADAGEDNDTFPLLYFCWRRQKT